MTESEASYFAPSVSPLLNQRHSVKSPPAEGSTLSKVGPPTKCWSSIDTVRVNQRDMWQVFDVWPIRGDSTQHLMSKRGDPVFNICHTKVGTLVRLAAPKKDGAPEVLRPTVGVSTPSWTGRSVGRFCHLVLVENGDVRSNCRRSARIKFGSNSLMTAATGSGRNSDIWSVRPDPTFPYCFSNCVPGPAIRGQRCWRPRTVRSVWSSLQG
jgi:hypothetical protein